MSEHRNRVFLSALLQPGKLIADAVMQWQTKTAPMAPRRSDAVRTVCLPELTDRRPEFPVRLCPRFDARRMLVDARGVRDDIRTRSRKRHRRRVASPRARSRSKSIGVDAAFVATDGKTPTGRSQRAASISAGASEERRLTRTNCPNGRLAPHRRLRLAQRKRSSSSAVGRVRSRASGSLETGKRQVRVIGNMSRRMRICTPCLPSTTCVTAMSPATDSRE
jgi:hypothetical protein